MLNIAEYSNFNLPRAKPCHPSSKLDNKSLLSIQIYPNSASNFKNKILKEHSTKWKQPPLRITSKTVKSTPNYNYINMLSPYTTIKILLSSKNIFSWHCTGVKNTDHWRHYANDHLVLFFFVLILQKYYMNYTEEWKGKKMAFTPIFLFSLLLIFSLQNLKNQIMTTNLVISIFFISFWIIFSSYCFYYIFIYF